MLTITAVHAKFACILVCFSYVNEHVANIYNVTAEAEIHIVMLIRFSYLLKGRYKVSQSMKVAIPQNIFILPSLLIHSFTIVTPSLHS